MSTFKRALSLLLCLVMLFSTVSVAASLASAADAADFVPVGVSSIKSYSDLEAAHDNFIYIGTDIYEEAADGSYALTDHYVDAGTKLKIQVFIKTDLYTGTGTPGFVFDNNFFDIQNGTGAYDSNTAGPANSGHADLAANGVSMKHTGMMLTNVPVVKMKKLTVPDKIVDSKYILTTANMAVQYAGYTRDTASTYCYECNEDVYFYEFYVTVREGLADGTRGLTYAEPYTYTVIKNVDAAAATGTPPFDVKTATDSSTRATSCKMMSAMGFTLDNIILEDAYHLFTIGDAPKIDVKFVLPAGEMKYDNSDTLISCTAFEDYEVASNYAYYPVELPADPEVNGFLGWAPVTESKDDAGNVIYQVGQQATEIKAATTETIYVAKTTKAVPHNVIYKYTDKNGEAATQTMLVPEEGEYTIAQDIEPIAKTGYKFIGWSTTENATEAMTGTQVMGTEDVTYYPVYTPELYKITVRSGNARAKFTVKDENGTESQKTEIAIEKYYGETLTAEEIQVPAYTGFEFNGWTMEEGATSGVTAGEVCKVTGNLIVTGTWKVKPFEAKIYHSEADYKAGKVAETLMVEPMGAFKPTKTITIPADSKFGEWVYVDASGEAKTFAKTLDPSKDKILQTSDFSIYPVFTKYNYSLSYKVWNYAENAWVDLGSTVYTDTAKYNAEYFNGIRKTITADHIGVEGLEVGHPYAELNADGSEKIGFTGEYLGMSFSDKDYTAEKDIAYNKPFTAKAPKTDTSNNVVTSTGNIISYADAKVIGADGKEVAGADARPANIVDGVVVNKDGLKIEGLKVLDAKTQAEVDEAALPVMVDRYQTILDLETNEEKNVTIYIYTKVKFNISDTRYTFDADGKWTGVKETFTDAYYPLPEDYHKTEVNYNINKSKLTSPDSHYEFVNFTDAEGNVIVPAAETDAMYTIAISAKNGSNVTINTNYDSKGYIFYFSPEGITNILQTVDAYRIGDTFDPATAKFINKDTGEEVTLPEIGVAAEAQKNPITSMAGHKLVGWEFQRIAGENIKFPITITEELISNTIYAGDEAIRIAAVWEPIPYTANFYYTNAADEKILLTSIEVNVGTPLDQFAPMDSETRAILNAAAPEGQIFSRWQAADGNNDTSMTIGGRDYIAVFTTMTFGVYVDYNNGKNLDENGNKILKRAGSASYGENIEFGDSDYQAAGFTIRTESFASTNANLPSETSVTAGWKVFYVETTTDIADPEKWIEGYNDKNENTEAYSAIIYQAQWFDYSDFLVRINDTEGKLYLALTKNFKVFYWNNDKLCAKENAVLKPIEDDIILFYTISFENGLSLTPFAVNSSLFTLEGIAGLFEALGNAIGGLIGDLFE